MKVVSDWRRAHKWMSMQSMVFVNALLISWAAIPEKFQDALPIGWVIAISATALGLGTVGRLVQQAPKDREPTA